MKNIIGMIDCWSESPTDKENRLLVLGDSTLYSQRSRIAEQLPVSFSLTTLALPAALPSETFLRIVELFARYDTPTFQAVYFRPELPCGEEEYRQYLEGARRLLPDAIWLLGTYGDGRADGTVRAVAEEYALACLAPEELGAYLSTVACKPSNRSCEDDGETVFWLKCDYRGRAEGRSRVLLIGDSIIWGGHKYTADALSDTADVVTVVSSLGINEQRFSGLIQGLCDLDGADYDAVYFNNGLHPHGQTPEAYRYHYKRAVTQLMRHFSTATWIVGLCTPISDNPSSGEQHETPVTERRRTENRKKNELVLQYNEQVRDIAEDLSLPCLDAYSLLADKDEWKVDCYHYNHPGRKLFGDAVASKILSETEQDR